MKEIGSQNCHAPSIDFHDLFALNFRYTASKESLYKRLWIEYHRMHADGCWPQLLHPALGCYIFDPIINERTTPHVRLIKYPLCYSGVQNTKASPTSSYQSLYSQTFGREQQARGCTTSCWYHVRIEGCWIVIFEARCHPGEQYMIWCCVSQFWWLCADGRTQCRSTQKENETISCHSGFY